MATTETPPALKRAMRTLDDDFLECRDVKHWWGVIGYWRAPDGVICRDLVCQRCETQRTDRWIRATGERLDSRYKYATGYQVEADGDRPHFTDVRLEVIRRADVYANEQQMLKAMTGASK
jgi:hypothetical protein